MSGERWLPVPGWEGLYEGSNRGRVRSLDRVVERSDGVSQRVRARELKQIRQRSGYMRVTLYGPDGGVGVRVHRLVALAFLGDPGPGRQVCHWNDVPDDNRVENLRWGTAADNRRDEVRNGRHANARKTRCPAGHEYTPANTYWARRGNGKTFRQCRACRRNRKRSGCAS